MSIRLIQYRLVESAWKGGLLPWLQDHARDGLKGNPAWLVVDQASQSGWIKTRMHQAELSSIGLEWHTAAGLRRRLFDVLGSASKPLGRENLELLLRLRAGQSGTTMSRSVAADASDALQALDELARAGWSPELWDNLLPPEMTGFYHDLERSNAWLPLMERVLQNSSQHFSGHPPAVLIYGWGGSHFADLRLITWLAELGALITLMVPQPRFLYPEDEDAAWISCLEERLGIVAEVCPEEDEVRLPYEGFVRSLVTEAHQDFINPPDLLVGHTDEEQCLLVVDWLQKKRVHDNKAIDSDPVGILFPGESASLIRMTELLNRLGVHYCQEIGECAPSGPFHQFHQLLAHVLICDGDVEAAMNLFEWMKGRNEPVVESLDIVTMRSALSRLSGQHATREMAPLLRFRKESSTHAESCEGWAKALERWPEELNWPEAKQRWIDSARIFGFGTDYLEPVWSTLDQLLQKESVPSRLFVQYVQGLLDSPGMWYPEEMKEVTPSRLVLTTLEAAAGRVWGSLVFMDSEEGVWPVPPRSNPLLPDLLKKIVNSRAQRGTVPLTTLDNQLVRQQTRVLDLLENVTGSVLFSAALWDGGSPGMASFPNSWAAQVLLARLPHEAHPLKAWKPAGVIRLSEAASVQQPDAKLESFCCVHRVRHDASLPPGDWEFRFNMQPPRKEKNLSLWASRLENMLHFPATWALEAHLRAQPRRIEDFGAVEAKELGVRVHRLLADWLGPFRGKRISDAATQNLEYAGNLEGTVSGLMDAQAFWMAHRMREDLLVTHPDARVVHVEWSPPEVSRGGVVLSGRLDLVLESLDGKWIIVDFKTGSTGGIPTPRMLKEKGDGLQYVAYLHLLGDVPEVVVQVLSPQGWNNKEMTRALLEDAEEHLKCLERMMRSGTFPRRGALRSRHGAAHETLPLTTRPSTQVVIDSKWQLFLEQEATQEGDTR
ncbi:MAG: PD-(D/E)XK nuclease family protein [Candidatus Methylacidiphilales bacterium]